MAQQVRQRFQNPVPYQANSTVSIPLSRGMVYRELYLKLSGTLTPDGTNAIAAANIQAGDEWALITRIQIIANGSDVLWNSSGEQLAWLNYFLENSRRRTITGASSATVAKTFDSTLVLPFWMPKAIRPIDTALDSSLLSDLRLEVTWGSVSSVTSATGATFGTTPVLSVWSLESFGLAGTFSQKRVFRQQYTNTGVSSQFTIQLPVGAMYRGFLLSAKDANGVDVNYVSNIKIRSGTTVFVDIDATALRDAARIYEGRDYLIDNSYAKLPLVFVSTESVETGWNFLDLCSDYMMSEAIDTIGYSELIMELNITTSIVTLEILPLQIIPVRQAKSA